ncbi:MAG: MaoC family dehydratase [Alphaproteobacteria bacterium]|nr:MaoC family dehydratase [Alphaproteobacteria bacterium]MCB9792718.1 MaoC family dehydratase [Alphaproteobacteria bacterium]
MTVLINGAQGLLDHSGEALGATEWETMTFERIQAFADATDDHQWIHVDRERIAKESPFGAPIAHGYLTLSLVAGKFFDLLELQGFDMVINYGLEKVRFPNPLKEGQRFRLAFTLGNVSEKRGWYEALFIATIEIEGEAKPACVAEAVYRFKPSA